jgi:hypothetical protein
MMKELDDDGNGEEDGEEIDKDGRLSEKDAEGEDDPDCELPLPPPPQPAKAPTPARALAHAGDMKHVGNPARSVQANPRLSPN